jgi:peptidoglycan/LPS O-acetylase OafA/YrhL
VSATPQRFTVIDGLRGALALWIVADHCLGSRFGVESLSGVWRVLRSGWYAVDLFCIISGFAVAAHIANHPGEPYLQYLWGRVRRLWPLYAVTTLAAVSLAWEPVFASDHFLIRALSVATMTQGLIPETWLPDSQAGFYAVAWYVSLVFQFYLVAPLLIRPLKHSRWAWISPAVALALFYAQRVVPRGRFDGILPWHIGFFYCGILTYVLLSGTRKRIPGLSLIVVAALFILMKYWWGSIDTFPLAIWCVTVALCLERGGPFKAALASAPARWLGAISYEIYMIHPLVVAVVRWRLFGARVRGLPAPSYTALLALIVFPVSIALAFLAHRAIAALGTRLATPRPVDRPVESARQPSGNGDEIP